MTHIIPIKNLYHMLCYAWDVLPQAELINIDLSGNEQPIELLAEVLLSGAHHLFRRGIEQNYIAIHDIVTPLRGRIDAAYSERRGLLKQGHALCTYDEISADILPNQILKTTFASLCRAWGLHSSLRKQSGNIVRRLHSVRTIQLTDSAFARARLHGKNRFYRFLMDVCELIYHESMLDEREGNYRFRDFFRDEGKMSTLYEKFIFNFYKTKLKKYDVTKERIRWDATSLDDPLLSLLPTMLTDISLRSKEATLIIDAKYYKQTLVSFHGNQRIHSGNLYQVNAYLQNIERNGGNDAYASGMLLYPVVQEKVSAQYELSGKKIRIETIDLSQDWQKIELDLLSLVG